MRWGIGRYVELMQTYLNKYLVFSSEVTLPILYYNNLFKYRIIIVWNLFSALLSIRYLFHSVRYYSCGSIMYVVTNNNYNVV